MEGRESAVGRLLREHDVGGAMSLREAAKRTGVSRETLRAWLAPVDPTNPIRHNKVNLDRVADGLGIDRIELGNASMVDNGSRAVPIEAGGDAVLARLLDLQLQTRAILDAVTQLTVLYVQQNDVRND